MNRAIDEVRSGTRKIIAVVEPNGSLPVGRMGAATPALDWRCAKPAICYMFITTRIVGNAEVQPWTMLPKPTGRQNAGEPICQRRCGLWQRRWTERPPSNKRPTPWFFLGCPR
jgi:hypothetical protein